MQYLLRNNSILFFSIFVLFKQMKANYIETSKYNYWIIPQDVGLDKNLKPQDKLVYAQILSLTKQKGYCFATNDYLSKLNSDVCKRTIINSIHNLKSNNHIRIEFDNKEKNNSKRKIFITNLKVMNNNSLLNTKENHTSHENKFYIIRIKQIIKIIAQ